MLDNGCVAYGEAPSMEPPPFGGGNFVSQPLPVRNALVAHPSMEPPPFGGGNFRPWTCWKLRIELYPSMEPPPFGGGNDSVKLTGSPVSGYSAFNGATPFRRWKLSVPIERVIA